MKRTSLLMAALLPFVATAGAQTGVDKLDHQTLRDDVQVTRLLGADVESGDGQNIGSVEDITLDRDGKVTAVIVQRGGDVERVLDDAGHAATEARTAVEDTWDEATDDRARRTRDDTAVASRDGAAGDADADFDPDRVGSTEMGDDFVKVELSDMSFDAEAGVVRLNVDSASLQPAEYSQDESSRVMDEVRASKLVGMEVNLTDEESFGEVEDVLINMQDGSASALIVDSMEFFDKERYALPVELQNLNEEEEELTLEITQQEIEALEEFDMDNDDAQM